MSKNDSKNIADLEAERRELDRKIRAAKRAEAKAAKAVLLSARQALGVRLAEAVGADTVAAAELLDGALESGQIRATLRRQIGTESPDEAAPVEVAFGGDRDDRNW